MLADISKAITATMDIIQNGDVIRDADVVLVTDGASDATWRTLSALGAHDLDVTILGIGIGVEKSALSRGATRSRL